MRLQTLVPVFLAVVLAALPIRADTPNAEPAAGIQAVILKQLNAFQRDDAHAAFALASPSIQQKFGSSAVFMEMVRTGYAPVYRPRTVEFGDLVESDGRYLQHVILEGHDGTIVMAVYPMVLDDAGQWRIAGCTIQRIKRKST